MSVQERPNGRSAAKGTILAGGIALVAGALAFLGVFSYLAARFHYPEILDGSAQVVLPALLATGAAGRTAWALYGVLPLVFIPAGVGAFEALRERAPGPMRVGLLFAFLAAVTMMLGLIRWPSVHWELARAWGSAAEGERLVLAAVFDGLNTYLGNFVGEFLGELSFSVFFVLSGVGLLRHERAPTWLSWWGIADRRLRPDWHVAQRVASRRPCGGSQQLSSAGMDDRFWLVARQGESQMKAILHTRYGSPDLLQFQEVNKPSPKDNEVLIAIHATTVSTADCNIRNFTFVTNSMRPMAKLMFGLGRPWRARILGTELAGEVESAGKDVKRFRSGDRVVASTGMAGGGHAQYACLREKGALAFKPDSLSWEEAVALPFGANTALYFLRDLGKIQAGQKVLIIGASGSVGSAGVQLARHFGATVTAVCSGANVEMVKSLGADKVIDYTKEDFTTNADTYDLIFDIVGATTFQRCRHSLKPHGIFLQNIMGLTDIVRIIWTSIAGGKKLKGGVALENPERMTFIAELAAAGKLKPVIDRCYPLEQIADAFKYVEQGHKKGNVVITVTPTPTSTP